MPPSTIAFTEKLTADARSRLLEHFSGDGPPANDRWAALWDKGDFLPWDRGTPSLALEDALKEHKDLLGPSVFITDALTGETRRKRALVPGCGRGYDVLLLASFGYDAVGLEVSSEAIACCKAFAQANKEKYPVQDGSIGPGKATFIQGDFFKEGWLNKVDGGRTFELFYDYTFFCALAPAMRHHWALRLLQLVSPHPESRLICLEFPTCKAPNTGGPPFGVPSPVYVAHLGHPGSEQPYDAQGNLLMDDVKAVESPCFQRIAHWKAERTHEVGKGTDWVSIWKAA
ncbi:hypothetical protein J3458_012943 [Metarhizium acridum]|uniref:uncharacterized protein n=1 Tax=Metarhizium acridum TaxID=92637 RepID=UPI001C6B0A58|nr:hypothetical protein J3458_012943 [Metarhizium acridum]